MDMRNGADTNIARRTVEKMSKGPHHHPCEHHFLLVVAREFEDRGLALERHHQLFNVSRGQLCCLGSQRCSNIEMPRKGIDGRVVLRRVAELKSSALLHSSLFTSASQSYPKEAAACLLE